MSETGNDRPVWVELSSTDAAGARDFYSRLFGWDIEVIADPQYGGYGMARLGGDDVAGIGPQQTPGAPSNWGVYLGTDNVDALAEKVKAAGGTVVAAPFDVGDQGRMAVFLDPTGAFISGWQAGRMRNFGQGRPNMFGYFELNTRDLDAAIPFYQRVFGWTTRRFAVGEGPEYIEFLHEGKPIAGAWPMQADAPAEMPSYWAIYFVADDVDKAAQRAVAEGGSEIVQPQDFPGGRFSLVSDPQGGMFGVVTMAEGQG